MLPGGRHSNDEDDTTSTVCYAVSTIKMLFTRQHLTAFPGVILSSSSH
jgi:hypothetical protein